MNYTNPVDIVLDYEDSNVSGEEYSSYRTNFHPPTLLSNSPYRQTKVSSLLQASCTLTTPKINTC